MFKTQSSSAFSVSLISAVVERHYHYHDLWRLHYVTEKKKGGEFYRHLLVSKQENVICHLTSIAKGVKVPTFRKQEFSLFLVSVQRKPIPPGFAKFNAATSALNKAAQLKQKNQSFFFWTKPSFIQQHPLILFKYDFRKGRSCGV